MTLPPPVARLSARRGAALIEMLIAGLISLLMGAAILSFTLADYTGRNVVQGQNNANASARHALDMLCDSLRNAQPVQIQSSPVVNAALQTASATSVTVYNTTIGGTARYWLDTTTTPPALKKTSGSATTVLLSGVTALTLTYYTSGQYTAGSAAWQTTTVPNSPTSAELPKIGAVGVSVTISINGYYRQMSSFVRLRNSPL